jgi:uncharacterized protein YukE
MGTNEFGDAAARVRAEVRRLTDVHDDLRRAMRIRFWQGPASDRFEASIGRRERELAEQRDLLDLLARWLEDAAHAMQAQHREPAGGAR